MRRSEDYDSLIDALFEGEVDVDEAARLLDDATADELEELSELADTLARLDPAVDLPSAGAFRAARRNVLARLAADAAPAPRRVPRWLPLAAALAAFAVGWGAGRVRTAPAAQPAPLSLADLVAQSAQSSAPGADLRYSNLRLREVDADTLALSVDVATELELVRPRNDALVSDILAGALVTDDDLGGRLKAVRYAGTSPRLRRALISAALNDPNVSVRLKALERLIEQDPTAAETQETLLTVIESDSAVGMRLLALDALDDDYVSPALLDDLDGAPTTDGEAAVLWRAQQRLNRRSL